MSIGVNPPVSRQRILDAAVELFSDHGFDATSVSQIAAAAGVSKALIYYSFESKEAILLEVLRTFKRDLSDAFTRIYSRTDRDRTYGSWETEEIRQGLAFFIEHRRVWSILVAESLKSATGRDHLLAVWTELNEVTRGQMLRDRGFSLEGDLTKDIVDLFFIFLPTVLFSIFRGDWAAQQESSEDQIAASFSTILNTLYATFLRENARAELLRHTIAAQEEERRRIARELHDETSQALTALMLAIDTTSLALAAGSADAPARLANARSIADGLLGDVHRLTEDLRPSLLDDLGLVPAIAWYGEERLEPKGIRLRLEGTGLATRLPAPVETALFRIVQEALTNVIRHSGATRVVVGIDLAGESLTLRVTDNGRGFEPEPTGTTGTRRRSFGLQGMRERVRILGGEFHVAPVHGTGVTITVTVPVAAPDGTREPAR